jgi:multisite-specific tRNA:(cytosine-C5)-methyltransferase
MLPKEERKAMLLRLFNDESELVDHSKDRDRGIVPKAETGKTEIKEGSGLDESKTNSNHKPLLEEIVKAKPDTPVTEGPGDAGEPGEKELEGKEPNGTNVKEEDSNGPIAASIHQDIWPGDTITGILDDYEDEKAASALRGEDQQRRDELRGTIPEQRDEDNSFNKTV